MTRPTAFPDGFASAQREATLRVAEILTEAVAKADAERNERWRQDPHQKRDPRANPIYIDVSTRWHGALPFCFERSKPADGRAMKLKIAGVWVPTHPHAGMHDDTLKIHCASTHDTIFVSPAGIDPAYGSMYDTFRRDGFSPDHATEAIDAIVAAGVRV